MDVFAETKRLVEKEKYYTAGILKKLMIIERNKLYCDLKYPSLFKYLTKELGYADAEAVIRVNAVRLMIKSKNAAKKVISGELSLTNASIINRCLKNNSGTKKETGQKIEKYMAKALDLSSRKLKKYLSEEENTERAEQLTLNENIIKKFDRMRKKYGDLSTIELILILLEKELNAPTAMRNVRSHTPKNSRSIPKLIKLQVYKGSCTNCGTKHGLEYDHIRKYSHGGDNSLANIQVLCRSCNQRKEIKARQSNLFI